MTPLAQRVARELTLPVKQRRFENKAILGLIAEEMHCFDISAIAKPINDAMMAENVWPDVATMLPDLFLPSPVTWLEFFQDGARLAYVISQDESWFHIDVVHIGRGDGEPFGITFGDFRPCSILRSPDRIELQLAEGLGEPDVPKDARPETSLAGLAPADTIYDRSLDVGNLSWGNLGARATAREITRWARKRADFLDFKAGALARQLHGTRAELDLVGAANHVIAFSVLALDLINTPGLVGFRQHAPHAAFAKQFAMANVGAYPLRAWSEVTVKTHTEHCDGDYETGPTYRKCLHFVRAHERHYRDGRVSIVRAHWRGDPALGIKRTRYRVAA